MPTKTPEDRLQARKRLVLEVYHHESDMLRKEILRLLTTTSSQQHFLRVLHLAHNVINETRLSLESLHPSEFPNREPRTFVSDSEGKLE